MKTNHPLAGCFELVDNWPELFQQWQDEIEFANKEFNNIKKSGDKIISKSPIPLINNFVKTSIKGIFRTSLTAVADQLKNIVPDSEKVKYLEGIIQTSEELNMRFNESNNMNEYKGSIQDGLAKLTYALHKKYDDQIFILKKRNEINDDKAKLKFNLNRSELVHLFVLLKDSNIIDSTYSDYAISKLLTDSFLYYNESEKKHAPLVRIKDFIRDIRIMEQYSKSTEEKVKGKIQDAKIIFK